MTSNLYPPSHALLQEQLGIQVYGLSSLLGYSTPLSHALHWSLGWPDKLYAAKAGLELTAILSQPPKCRILRPF